MASLLFSKILALIAPFMRSVSSSGMVGSGHASTHYTPFIHYVTSFIRSVAGPGLEAVPLGGQSVERITDYAGYRR